MFDLDTYMGHKLHPQRRGELVEKYGKLPVAPLRKVLSTFYGGVCTPYEEHNQLLECGHWFRCAIPGRDVDTWHPMVQADAHRCTGCLNAPCSWQDSHRRWDLEHNTYPEGDRASHLARFEELLKVQAAL